MFDKMNKKKKKKRLHIMATLNVLKLNKFNPILNIEPNIGKDFTKSIFFKFL